MKSEQFDNPIRRQVFDLPGLTQVQLESCFGHGLKELMTMAEIFDARKIILTGCGDSYAAAVAMAPVVERYCDCFGVQAMRAIDFTRFLPKNQIGIGEPNSPLVIAISAGGGTARICEVLEKANAVGAFSILMTNNPESRAAKLAKRVYCMGTPDFPDKGPGLRSYFASLIGLIAFANRLGHVRGTLPPTAPGDFQAAIRSHMEAFTQVLESVDEQMFQLAQQWQSFTRFDFIGDGEEFGSAFFGAAKFLEANGCTVSVDDSEDWCHINYFLKDPASIGTVIMADKNSPAYGREKETAASAAAIGRPVLVVTNGPREDFPGAQVVCCVPEAPAGYEWLLPLTDYIPASLLAGYIAQLQQEPFFRFARLADGTPDPNSDFANRGCMTLSNSKVEIYD